MRHSHARGLARDVRPAGRDVPLQGGARRPGRAEVAGADPGLLGDVARNGPIPMVTDVTADRAVAEMVLETST
jgi:hypothetical protein